ncbi:universal stress protein [Agromyces humatus]|uniref:UspA domain-containing protein n=1 Tax=Agromyces humatus TaxID=279573 RepID=A0ABN2KI32_9MICO|nr:universal stress protein [Agromyces humatus]
MDTTILVGIDGSVASRAAIAWAIARARGLSAEVSLLCVVDDEWGTISDRDLVELRKDAERLTLRELSFARQTDGRVPVSAAVDVGAPMLELASAAAAYESVVVGSHKSGTFHGYALGARGLQLAATAPVPIAIIPASSTNVRSGVVVGAGTAPGWIEAVRFAIREAARTDEPLTVIRSDRDVPFDDRALRALLDAGDADEASVDIVLRRSTTSAGEALASASRRAVLTVSGRPTEPGARGYRPLGRTNNDLLMNAGGPVVIVPHLTAG